MRTRQAMTDGWRRTERIAAEYESPNRERNTSFLQAARVLLLVIDRYPGAVYDALKEAGPKPAAESDGSRGAAAKTSRETMFRSKAIPATLNQAGSRRTAGACHSPAILPAVAARKRSATANRQTPPRHGGRISLSTPGMRVRPDPCDSMRPRTDARNELSEI
jgi:hypothetical protein